LKPGLEIHRAERHRPSGEGNEVRGAMKRRRTTAPVLFAVAAIVVLSCAGCRVEVKIPHADHGVFGPTSFELEGVPRPEASAAYGYYGYGHFFVVDGNGAPGRSFYWRDNHFVWADGSVIAQSDIPDSLGRLGVPDFAGLTAKEALGLSVHCLSGLGWWVRGSSTRAGPARGIEI
jgi:hypothetical protein